MFRKRKLFNVCRDYLAAIASLASSGVLSAVSAWYITFIKGVQDCALEHLLALCGLSAAASGLLVYSVLAFLRKREERAPFNKAAQFIKAARPKTCFCFYLIASKDCAYLHDDCDFASDLDALFNLGLIERSEKVKRGYKVYQKTLLGARVFEDQKRLLFENYKIWASILDSYTDMDDPSINSML